MWFAQTDQYAKEDLFKRIKKKTKKDPNEITTPSQISQSNYDEYLGKSRNCTLSTII